MLLVNLLAYLSLVDRPPPLVPQRHEITTIETAANELAGHWNRLLLQSLVRPPLDEVINKFMA